MHESRAPGLKATKFCVLARNICLDYDPVFKDQEGADRLSRIVGNSSVCCVTYQNSEYLIRPRGKPVITQYGTCFVTPS